MNEIYRCYEHTVMDAHTHIGGVAYTNMLLGGFAYSQNIADLLDHMDCHGITHAIVTPFPVFYGHRDERLADEALAEVLLEYERIPYGFANRMLLKEVEVFGQNRFFPFVLMALNRDLDQQIEEVDRLAETCPVCGVKLYTVYDNVSLSEMIGCRKFTDFLKRRHLPVMIHSSCEGKGDPEDILKFAKAYPDIPINIAHMARFKKKALYEIRHMENVYMDFSPLPALCRFMKRVREEDAAGRFLDLNYDDPGDVLAFICGMFPEKALYGSDAPFYRTGEYKDLKDGVKPDCFTYKDSVELLRTLPANQRDRVASKNIVRYLFGMRR